MTNRIAAEEQSPFQRFPLEQHVFRHIQEDQVHSFDAEGILNDPEQAHAFIEIRRMIQIDRNIEIGIYLRNSAVASRAENRAQML